MNNKENTKIYFDQNILGWMTSGYPKTAKYFVNENLSLLFSRVNLEEISGTDNVERYLEFLRDSNAEYVELIMSGGRYTDNAGIEKVDPFKLYENFIKDKSSGKGLSYVLGQFAYKLYGGETNHTFSGLSELFLEGIRDLSDDTLEEMSEQIEGNPNNITIEDIKEILEHFNSYMGFVSDEVKSSLAENIKDESKFGGVTDVRQFYNSQRSGFSDIEPPNIFQKIWERIENSGVLSGYDITKEQFLGLEPYGKQVEGVYTVPEKIMSGYGMLNSVGYWPDKKLKKERTFFSSFRDMGHAVYAAYSNMFYTADERLAKKARAIYENLKIGPRVVFVKVETPS